MPFNMESSLLAYSGDVSCEGSFSLKGVAAQNNSLNKTLTKSLSTPINLSGYSYILGRIRGSRTGSNVKIGFRQSIINTLTGGTASADSQESSGYQASYFCDNNTSSRWSTSNSVHPHWWKYDYGSGITKTIRSIGFCTYADVYGCTLKNFVLSGSNDNVSYTDIYSDTVPEIMEDKTWVYFNFTNITAYRYYKITFLDSYRADLWLNFNGCWEVVLSEVNHTYYEVTPNITSADTWQTIQLDISAVSDANKDSIDQIIITVVNADADNTFYLDNFFAADSTYFGAGTQVSKAVGYAVLTPIEAALNVSKVVGYAVLIPVSESSDSGPMIWIF